jgi:hypothetical protein
VEDGQPCIVSASAISSELPSADISH